eukprot:1148655-Pelagomonas_calceolata.AAC.4
MGSAASAGRKGLSVLPPMLVRKEQTQHCQHLNWAGNHPPLLVPHYLSETLGTPCACAGLPLHLQRGGKEEEITLLPCQKQREPGGRVNPIRL